MDSPVRSTMFAMRPAVLVLCFAAALSARDRIAAIEFFGSKGIDVEAVRRALPFHEGDPHPKHFKQQAIDAVQRVTGHPPTDVSAICCISDGDGVIFIGLPGASTHPFRYDAAPGGDAPPARDLVRLAEAKDKAWSDAVRRGASEEDGSPGYSLLKEPRARAAQLALRDYARRHEEEIIRTLETDRRAGNRALAADALGYGTRTPRQLAALVHAARDPDDSVRNDATRALWEILRAEPSAGVPAAPFIEMVQSGIWTDRNKASLVLEQLAKDPPVREQARREAGDALAEMAAWREEGWALSARSILGR